MKRAVVGLAVVLGVIVSCESGGSLSGPSSVGLSVSVSPTVDTIFAADTIKAGDATTLVAVVRSAATGGRVTVPVTWTTSDSSVASVDATGVVRARKFGSVTITADASGKTATARVTVVQRTQAIAVTPGTATVLVDDPIAPSDTARLTARATDRDGVVVTGTRVTWRSSAPAVASVDASGLVRAVGLGTATITATGAGVSGSGTVTVRPLVKTVTVLSSASQALVFDTLQMTASATGQSDQALAGRKFTWQSSNTAVATVNDSGRVILVGRGTVRITATSGFVSSGASVDVLPRALASLDVGKDFTCGAANLGRGYCWGKEEEGRLGVVADSLCHENVDAADSACTISPRRFAPAVTFRSVSAGGSSACGIGSDSHVYCWGSDSTGQLGDGLRGTTVSDLVVRATVSTIRFQSVSVGGAHACAISTTSTLYCWGADSLGQLGDARRINSTTPIPLAVAFENDRWLRVSAGDRHTCAIRLTGEAYCWGNNEHGQLGDGSDVLARDVPVPVAGGLLFREISAGSQHTCGVTTTGGVACWGNNVVGQLGTDVAPLTVVRSPVLTGLGSIADLSAGHSHTCARGTAGAVQCWGLNDWGQLGNGNSAGFSVSPAVIAGFTFRLVSAGLRHTCGIATDEVAYCWGSNVFGALGNELQAAVRATPQRVATPR